LNLYLALKFLHVTGAAVLFGTGLGIAFFQFMADRDGDPGSIAETLRTVVIADYVFIATAVIVQPLTGLLLADLRGYALNEFWIVASTALYVLTGTCWLPVVVIQIRLRDLAMAAAKAGESTLPPRYHRLMRLWFWLGWPAFVSVLGIIWLMIAKPV
jgi:uncharacterized membrane protein